ncbi:hypothetical protein [Oceanidesulfovibrio indonesiensis]|uniref:hypothetical protein n=1 Tax=Oceanidesulfovibrio indonesiensis TaxID=54767 RepID=UPI001184C380|nr:hypothetical protein [Oceanidesulfovibrio indonesiensis]
MNDILELCLNNISWLSDIGQIVTAMMLVFISINVHGYTKRRDRLDFFLNTWSQAQDNNLNALANDNMLRSFEEVVYGDAYKVDIDVARSFFNCFLIINRVQNFYFAYRNKIISLNEFKSMAIPTIRLLSRQKEMVTYLVNERGYSDDFVKVFLALLNDSEPYSSPNF